MAGFDPTAALFELSGKARMLHVGKVVALVLISDDYIQLHRDAPVRFLEAFTEAYYYYAGHQDDANAWFIRDSQLSVGEQVLDLAASVEPNVHAKSVAEIDLDLYPELISRLQEAADFVYDEGLVKKRVMIEDYINLTYLQQASIHIKRSDDISEHIKVK